MAMAEVPRTQLAACCNVPEAKEVCQWGPVVGWLVDSADS